MSSRLLLLLPVAAHAFVFPGSAPHGALLRDPLVILPHASSVENARPLTGVSAARAKRRAGKPGYTRMSPTRSIPEHPPSEPAAAEAAAAPPAADAYTWTPPTPAVAE